MRSFVRRVRSCVRRVGSSCVRRFVRRVGRSFVRRVGSCVRGVGGLV